MGPQRAALTSPSCPLPLCSVDEDSFAHPSRLADPLPRAATMAMFTLLISLLPNPYSNRSSVTLPSHCHQHAALPTASLCPTFQPGVLMRGGCITPRWPSCLSPQHPGRLQPASLPSCAITAPSCLDPHGLGVTHVTTAAPNESWVHSFQAGRDVNVPFSNQPPLFSSSAQRVEPVSSPAPPLPRLQPVPVSTQGVIPFCGGVSSLLYSCPAIAICNGKGELPTCVCIR